MPPYYCYFSPSFTPFTLPLAATPFSAFFFDAAFDYAIAIRRRFSRRRPDISPFFRFLRRYRFRRRRFIIAFAFRFSFFSAISSPFAAIVIFRASFQADISDATSRLIRHG